MRYGFVSGLLWGLDSLFLGFALAVPFFVKGIDPSAAALAAAFIHDGFCALFLLCYLVLKGRIRELIAAWKSGGGRAVMLGAVLGGPVGMAGYVFAISNIGPAYTAALSAIYPAVGALLAYLILKEKMRPQQLFALAITLIALVVLGWSSQGSAQAAHPLLGLLGAFFCVAGWGSEAVACSWALRNAEEIDTTLALTIREASSALIYAVIVIPALSSWSFVLRASTQSASLFLVAAAVWGTLSYLSYYKAIDLIGAARSMALNISYAAWALIFTSIAQLSLPPAVQVIASLVIIVGTIFASNDWAALLGKDLEPSEAGSVEQTSNKS